MIRCSFVLRHPLIDDYHIKYKLEPGLTIELHLKKNVLPYIHLSSILVIMLVISYFIPRLLPIDMNSFLFWTWSIVDNLGKYFHIWKMNRSKSCLLMCRWIPIETTDASIIIVGSFIYGYLLFDVIIQNKKIRKTFTSSFIWQRMYHYSNLLAQN